jgi:hypothetical protein
MNPKLTKWERWLLRTRVSEYELAGNFIDDSQRLLRWLYYWSGDKEKERRELLHAEYIEQQYKNQFDRSVSEIYG